MHDGPANMPQWNCWLSTLQHNHGARRRAGNAYISLPQTMPACTLATDGMKHGDESQVKEANVLTELAAAERPAAHSAAHVKVHDSELAMPITALPHMPPTRTLITEAMVHRDGSH